MTRRLAAAAAALLGAAALVLTAAPPAGPAPVSAHEDVFAAQLGWAGAVSWSPADHDRVALSADAPDMTELPTVHGVYLYPSDAPSRFADFAGYFQAEHGRADKHLGGATGMTFRWDLRPAKDGSGRIVHDITAVKAKANLRTLSSSKGFALIGDSLAAAGLTDPDKKYYVWLDAKGDACGQAQSQEDPARTAQNKAQGSSYAVSYRPNGGETMYAAVGGWCAPVVHELTHALGAVGAHAPNSAGGGHCNDDAQDIMCYANQGPAPYDPAAPRTYDFGNDDYLDPAADLDPGAVAAAGRSELPWWTVNLSRFLCPRSDADPAVSDCTKANEPLGAWTGSAPAAAPPTTGKPGRK